VPLTCAEVEKAGKDKCENKDTERRTFVENKMSEALIRKCSKCQCPFIKIEGCNR
jgi:TRIAD3 protein (E3 ubiquitin-protein ligase RNF216)